MSGIIGSKLNHRGSGLVGSLGTDGQHLLSAGAGKSNVFETVASGGVTAAEATAIRQDVTTLALRQAVNENKAAFNLPNTFIDQFEDDTGIGTETTVDRHAGEYVHTVTVANTYDFQMQKWNSDGAIGTGSWTNGTTNDYLSGGTSGGFADYACGYINYIYDLAQDWRIRIFFVNRSNGTLSDTENYSCYSGLVTSNTTIAAGVDNASSGVEGRVFEQTNETSGNDTNYAMSNAANWADVLSSACVTAWGTGSSNHTYGSASVGHQQVDCSSGTTPWSASAYHFSHAVHGLEVLYDQDANTITMRHMTDTGFTAYATTGHATFSNVPATGRFICLIGTGGGQDAQANYWSTTYASVADAFKGYVSVPTVNATGTVIGTANVPSSAQTEVSGVMLYSDAAGTASIGTDLKIYFTCNGGTNWTEASGYTAVTPVFSSGVKMVKLASTTCTTGSDVRYKAVWANQADGSKQTRLQGIGLNY